MAEKKSLIAVFKRKPNDEASRFYAMCSDIPQMHSYIVELGDNDDGEDAGSIESFSTTATIDDNPGTGRVLDTYFFQPVGRRIERFAMRITIQHLHPMQIEAFIHQPRPHGPWLPFKSTLKYSLQKIGSEYISGPTIVAGLKSLIRQAQ